MIERKYSKKRNNRKDAKDMGENKLGIFSPWVIYAKQLNALFGKDPAIKMDFDNETPKISLYVDGQEKADALSKILPLRKEFGNVTMEIVIIPSNAEKTTANIFEDAFKGNPVLSYVFQPDTPGMYQDTCFVVFKNFVTQYKSDDLFDVHGITSCLLQDIAKDVLEVDGDVHYNTDIPSNLGLLSFVEEVADWPDMEEKE